MISSLAWIVQLKLLFALKKSKAVALVKWLSKKDIEKMQEEHQQVIEEKDNQIQGLEHTNEKHQHKILKLNKEIDDIIKRKTGT